eukprot:TRINITY_DN20775_c0_g1_i1.p1 TRINITY_DN20775_c0_g1~~TRINITY_DN20775_c0_g1_i1.p1  ORF type:complete len:313 (+),score=63.90 TRINITY_DN20775_c0_g1_i1:35-940(+)
MGEEGASVVPEQFDRLEDTAKEAQAFLEEASEEGVPVREMATALLLNALSLILNFCMPPGTYDLFSDSGLIQTNCTEANSKWDLHLVLSRTAGFASLFLMLLGCALAALVNGMWPCRRCKPKGAKRRRRLLLLWLFTMFLSMVALFLFQLSQDPGYILTQLQGGGGQDCSKAQVFKEGSGFDRVPLFLAGMAVSQYSSGLVAMSKHLWTDREDFKELKTAVQELGHDLIEVEHEVSDAVLETGHEVKATFLGLARPDGDEGGLDNGNSNELCKEPDSMPFAETREIDDSCLASCGTLCGRG